MTVTQIEVNALLMSVFSFGADLLAVRSPDAAFPSGEAVGEECVETLVAGNLQTFFPGWYLRLCQMSNAGWGVPDLVAVDPAGGLHVFELKDGGAERGLLEQGLGYALTAAARPPRVSWSSSDPLSDRDFVATRIGGFWLPRGKHRTDKLPAADVAFAQRSSRRLALVAKELACGLDDLRALAQNWHRVGHLQKWTQRDVHVHIVADFSARGDSTLVERAEALSKRGVRISLWDMCVRRDVATRRGWARLQLLTPDQEPMRWLAELAREDFDIATCWSWSYETHATGVGAYAREPELLGKAVVMALLQREGAAEVHWSFNVPGFAATSAYAEQARQCREFARRLAGRLERELGIRPSISRQGLKLRLDMDDRKSALAKALHAIKDSSAEAIELLSFA